MPSSFAADEVALTVAKVHLEFAGDPDGRSVPGVAVEGLPALASEFAIAERTAFFNGSAGEKGRGAARVVLHADQGKAMITTRPLPPAKDMNACVDYDPVKLTASGAAG